MNKQLFLVFVFFLIFFSSFSQESRTISWKGVKNIVNNDSLVSLLDFEKSIYDDAISDNNIYFEKIPIDSKNVDLKIIALTYTDIIHSELDYVSQNELLSEVKYQYYVGTEKKQDYLFFYLVPFRKWDNSIQKVTQFKIELTVSNSDVDNQKKKIVNNSVLSTGNWYKIGVNQTGLHKIDATFLSSMGVDISTINLRLYRWLIRPLWKLYKDTTVFKDSCRYKKEDQ